MALLWESDTDVAAEALAQLATDDVGPGVRAAAAGGAQFVEAFVVDKLPARTGELVVAALRKALADRQVDGAHAKAMEDVGPIAEEWAQEAILEAYEGGDEPLRLSAIRAMGYSGLTRSGRVPGSSSLPGTKRCGSRQLSRRGT